MTDPITILKTASELEPKIDSLDEIKKMREDSDIRLQETASNLIQAKQITSQTAINKARLSGLPFQVLTMALDAVGYAGRKINDMFNNMSEKQQRLLREKINRVVDKDVSISSLPTLASATEAYLYTEQEPDLAELFENLIANTVDRTKNVHPSFVEILKQLSSKDASLLKMLFPYLFDSEIAICSILLYRKEQGFKYIYRNLLSLSCKGTSEPYIEQDLPIIIDNLIRLQLITAEYGKFVRGVDYETAFRNRPEYQQFEQILRDDEHLKLEYGVLMITDFGRAFYKAVQSTTDSQID